MGWRGIIIEKMSVGLWGGVFVLGLIGWMVMLKKKDLDGKVVRVIKLVLYVGDVFDGVMLYYFDGMFVICG